MPGKRNRSNGRACRVHRCRTLGHPRGFGAARNRRLEAGLALRRRLGRVIGHDVLSEISGPGHPTWPSAPGS
jgi:hypothetical protein